MVIQIEQENLLTRFPHQLNYKASFAQFQVDGKAYLVWFNGSTLIRYSLDDNKVDLTLNLIISPFGVYYSPHSDRILVTDSLGSFYVVSPSFDVIYNINRNDVDVHNGIIDHTGNYVITYAFSGRNNITVMNIHDGSIQPAPNGINSGIIVMEHLTPDCLLAIDLKNNVFLANMLSGEKYCELTLDILPQCFAITHSSEEEIRIVVPNNFNELITLVIKRKQVTIEGKTQNKYEISKGETIKVNIKRVYDVIVISGYNTNEIKLAVCGLSSSVEIVSLTNNESVILCPYKQFGYKLEGTELSHIDRLYGLLVYKDTLYVVNRDGEFFTYKNISTVTKETVETVKADVMKAFGGINSGITNIRLYDSVISLNTEEILIQSKELNRCMSFKTSLNNTNLLNLQRVDTDGVVLLGSGMATLTMLRLNIPNKEDLTDSAVQTQTVDAEILFNKNNLDVYKICLSFSKEQNAELNAKALILARNKEEMRSPYYLYLFDVNTKTLVNLNTKNYKKSGISYLKYSTEAESFIVGLEDGKVDLIKNSDLDTEKGVTKKETLSNRTETVMSVSFNDKGDKIAVANSTFITLWIIKEGKWFGRPRPAKSHMISICDLEWLGEHLAVFSKDGKFEFWKNYGKVVGMNKALFSDVHMDVSKVERILGGKEKEFLVVNSSNTGFRMVLKEKN